MLAAIFSAAASHADAQRLLDHAELPDALTSRVAAHFGLDPGEVDRAALDTVLAHHAKRPYLTYADDRAGKQAAVTPQIADLVATEVAPAYREPAPVRRAGGRPDGRSARP